MKHVKRDKSMLAFFIAILLLLGFASGKVTQLSIQHWYHGLEKPFLTPPDVVFGPVWTIIYVLIAIAGWRIWRLDRLNFWRGGLFLLQLVLNYSWTLIFFGFYEVGWALLDISVLWVVIMALLWMFYRFDRLAFQCWIPYVVWVSFAVYLNFGIWLMN